MRTFKSLLAAVLAVVMIFCMSISSFAAYDEITYDDVSEMFNTTLDGVYSKYMKFVDLLGIMPAMGNDFDPGAAVSRGQALKIAYRMLHYNYDEVAEYSSVNTGFDESAEGGDINDVHMLKAYIAWAEDYQLINAEYVPESKFEAEKDITGQEFLTLICKVVGYADEASDPDGYATFTDVILYGTNVDAEAATVSREAAAVIVSRAMLYDEAVADVAEEMLLTFQNYEGGRLDCLATNVYGCNSTELVIRATSESPMSYEGITKDVLFSNGVQADVATDMSAYIGYPITVVYLDKDNSDTYTEDEELITYEFGTPLVNTATLADLTVYAYTGVTGAGSDGTTFALYTNSMLYLNGELWPDDESYRLNKLVNFTTFPNGDKVLNRPNLEFKFIQHGVVEMSNVVLATEWIPGKIMTVNNNYISVYSYYDNEIYIFDDDDVALSGIANPTGGDIVNFYMANGKMYVTNGNTVALGTAKIDNTGALVNAVTTPAANKGEEPTTTTTAYIPHLFLNRNAMDLESTAGSGVAVLDYTGTTFLAVEEAIKGTERKVEIVNEPVADAEGKTAEVEIRDLETNAIDTITVEIDRISSKKGSINAGDYFTYTTTKSGKANLYGVDPVKMVVVETEDYFITTAGKKYLKVDSYVGGEELVAGEVTLYVDRYEGVWSIA